MRARSTAVIASRVMAPIVDVLVRPGDRVRRGAPLVRLDAREINAAGVRASAALDAARRSAEAAASDTRAAEAALHMARLTHDRITALHAKRSATLQELDQATASLSAADAQLAGAVARSAAATAARDEAAGGDAGRADCHVLLGAHRAIRRAGRRTPRRSRHHGDARCAAAHPRGCHRVPARGAARRGARRADRSRTGRRGWRRRDDGAFRRLEPGPRRRSREARRCVARLRREDRAARGGPRPVGPVRARAILRARAAHADGAVRGRAAPRAADVRLRRGRGRRGEAAADLDGRCRGRSRRGAGRPARRRSRRHRPTRLARRMALASPEGRR